MSNLHLIYEATTKKLADFKDVYKYTSIYQAAFHKLVGFLTDSSQYTRKNIKMYFQAIMLINIRTKYTDLISAIQKDWKDETTNLIETMLQIIRYFEFLEGNKKSNKIVLQTSTTRPLARSRPSLVTSKTSYKN